MVVAKRSTRTKRGAEDKRAAPEETAPSAEASEVVVDLEGVSSERDDTDPDASAASLTGHARALANTVDEELALLEKAKLAPGASGQLRARADALDAAETAWSNARARAAKRSDVNKLRPEALRGHRDLSSALALFAGGDKGTRATLKDIGLAETDEDLCDDLRRLVALGRRHAPELEGTDVPAERVEEVAKLTERLEAARAGARDDGKGGAGGKTAQALTKSARALLRRRNRAYWHLAELVRDVCARGKHVHRHDPDAQRKYHSYVKRSKKVGR